jgi:hypothetical protein
MLCAYFLGERKRGERINSLNNREKNRVEVSE